MKHPLKSRVTWVSIIVFWVAACGGGGSDSADTGPAATGADAVDSYDASGLWALSPAERPPPGLRRLTQAEVDRVLELLLGEAARPAAAFLPQDLMDPYDNDADLQISSWALISGVEALAREVVGRLALDQPRLDSVVRCADTVPSDRDCLTELVRRVGRRALRRPMGDDEVTELVDLGVKALEETDGEDPDIGALSILQALLQHPEFLFRKEIGVPSEADPTIFELQPYEVAEKLSFFLTGDPPTDAVLDRVARDELETAEDRRALALELLDSPGAVSHWDRFHAQWMGWVSLASHGEEDSALLADMRRETRALLERKLFEERRPWSEIFSAEETFLTPKLAELYGLPSPEGDEGWVAYGESPRRGILSHGTFLSLGTKFDLVSLTRRGFFVRTRFMCHVFGPPPPGGNPDSPPDAEYAHDTAPCRKELYDEHTRNPSCAECHDLLDPIGWGLEHYGTRGQWIEHEPERPHCLIDGEGEVVGAGKFNGPAELGKLLVDNDIVQPCLVQQLYRYAIGRTLRPADEHEVARLVELFRDGGEQFDKLVVEIAGSEHFVTRRTQ